MRTYDQLAPARPRLQRDVLFTETPQGVLFHNAKGGFHLNSGSAYRFAALLVPHLDGRASVAELGDGLGETQQAMMASLVSSLLERGFARDVTGADLLELDDTSSAQRFSPQLNYIDHYVDGAADRFAAFRSARIVVLGTDETAAWCARSLARNGAGNLGLEAAVADDTEVTQIRTELTSSGVDISIRALTASHGPRGWADLGEVDVVVVAGHDAVAQVHRLESEQVPAGPIVVPTWVIGRRSVIGPLVEAGSQTTWCGAVRALGRGRVADEAAVWEQVAQPGLGAPAGPDGPMAAMIGNHLAYEVFRVLTGCLPAETRGAVVIQDLDSLDVVAEALLPDPVLPTTLPPQHGETEDWTLADPAYDAHAHEGAADEDPVAVALNQRSRLVQQHTGLIAAFTDDGWTQTPLKIASATLVTGRDRCERLVVADLDHVAAARLRLLDHVAVRHAATARTTPTSGRSLADGRLLAAPRSEGTTGHGAASTRGAAAARALGRAIWRRSVLDAVRGAPVHRVDLDSCLGEAAVPGTRTGVEVSFLLRAAQLLGVELEVLEPVATAGAARVALVRSPSHPDLCAGAAAVDLPVAVRDAVAAVVGTVQARSDSVGSADLTLLGAEAGVDGLDPWTLQVSDAAPTADADDTRSWEQAAHRLDAARLCPVAVRTTTSALASAGVETVAVTLVASGVAR